MNTDLFPNITNPKQRAFLETFCEIGMVKRAAELSGASTTSHYRWRQTDVAYEEAFQTAKQCAADRLEDELYRRAVEGVRKPTGWYKGKAGGYVQEYDTTAAIFLLKGLRPETYADRQDVRAIVESARSNQFGFRSIIEEVACSSIFRMK